MAFKTAEKCGEYTITTGTGTITTAGPPQQMQTFNAGIGTGNTCQYMLLSGNGTDWEQGVGTVTVSAGVTTVARATVVASTNSNAAISLVGTSFIFVTDPANFAGTNGLLDSLFGAVNGTYNLIRSGGTWSLAAAGGGAAGSGLFSESLSAVPTQATLGTITTSFQAGGSVANSAAGVAMTQPSTGTNDQLSFIRWAVPATPYTKKFLIQLTAPNSSATICAVGVGWTDATKLQIARVIIPGNTTPPQLYVTQYTNSTTFSTNPAGPIPYLLGIMAWISLADDGTNFTIAYSNDGTNYVTLQTGTKAGGFLGGAGYTNFCMTLAANAATAVGNLRSYA